MLLAGWIESASAVLRWSLEHQPLGFLQTITTPLVDLLSKYLELALTSTPLHPTLLPGILDVMKGYHIFLSSSAAEKFSGSLVEKITMSGTQCQGFALACIWAGAHQEDAGVGFRQLLLCPVVVEAALLKMAGWSQHKQQGMIKPQKQQTNKPSGKSNKSSRGKGGKQGSSGSTSRSSSARGRAGAGAAAAAGFEACTSSSNTTGSRRGEPGTAAATVPGSFAQLEVPPDHDLVAASLGSKAVSCFSSKARLCSTVSSKAASFPHARDVGGLMAFAPDAMFVLRAALIAAAETLEFRSNSSSSNTSSSSASSSSSTTTTTSVSRSTRAGSTSSTSVWGAVSTAKLLLEALALAGAEVEGSRSTDDSIEAVFLILSFLNVSTQLLPRAELEVFVSERGSLLLQVLSLVLDRIQQHQLMLQQLVGAPWSKLLEMVVCVITSFALDNESGKALVLDANTTSCALQSTSTGLGRLAV